MTTRTISLVRDLVIATMLMGAAPAFAQQPEAAPPPALTKLRLGTVVWVGTSDGKELRGRVTSIDGQIMEIAQEQTGTPILIRDIRRVETIDGLWDGALTGAGIGAAAVTPLAMLAVLVQDGGSAKGPLLAVYGLGAGFGALIGAGIDSHLEHRTTLYQAAGNHPTVKVCPVWGRKKAGVGVSVTWR